jgi:hypothetical protein
VGLATQAREEAVCRGPLRDATLVSNAQRPAADIAGC